jgi:hypothetical protein
MTRWLAALCGVTFLFVCYADAAETVGALRSARPECDPNYSDCSTLIRVYTTDEVDQLILKALENLGKQYDRELAHLKATVDTQSQQIAELRKKAGLR